jgi:lipoprotein-anchoring transpeptidase ErfK/SrfK
MLRSAVVLLLVLIVPPAPVGAEPAPVGTSGAALTPAQRQTLALQVQLDRAHFSPGEIDARGGSNTRAAQAALAAAGVTLDTATPATTTYTVTEADVAGPYAPVPEDMMEQSKLPALAYASILEALGERFHASPALLKALNPKAAFAAGEQIEVPNVERGPIGGPAAKVVVDKSDRAVIVLDAAGKAIARYPASMGSERDPLPVGEWKINGATKEPPVFNYNPDLFWDADPGHSKAKIPAGPNNPVGLVWIDLSKEHYGIHGTPRPENVGKTQSHGCIRLTNWDALELGGLIKAGMPAVLQE